MSERAWRLLVTEPTDGATNMAIDEALWRGRQSGGSPPTLRFFAWAPPTVSLGYGQPLGRDVDEVACRAHGVVLLAVDEPRVRALFPTTRDPLATLTTLEAALGRRPSFEAVADALAEAFEREHGLDLRPGGLSASEAERVATLVTERYASPAWLAASA